jgi:hypothetical protein
MSKPVSFWATLPPVSAIPYNHWELPRIMADADARTPGGGLWNWLELLNPGTVYKSAISLGCGSGLKELALLEHGIVEKIRACDISRERCDKAKATAAEPIHQLPTTSYIGTIVFTTWVMFIKQ